MMQSALQDVKINLPHVLWVPENSPLTLVNIDVIGKVIVVLVASFKLHVSLGSDEMFCLIFFVTKSVHFQIAISH